MSALRLSLTKAYPLRWTNITYRDSGVLVDPRGLFTPKFQLVSPEATAFDETKWVDGEWEDFAPSTPAGLVGPFAADFIVGPGQSAGLNPNVAGVYTVRAMLYQAAGPTPEFPIGTIVLSAP